MKFGVVFRVGELFQCALSCLSQVTISEFYRCLVAGGLGALLVIGRAFGCGGKYKLQRNQSAVMY
jgi:hypothetical protein